MNVGIGPTIPDLKMPQIVADNLKMQNPHYEGFNADGGHYWVKAQTAQQDLKLLSDIRLNGITGELTDAKKQKTNLVATRGMFDNKSNILELYESIKVTGDGGLDAQADSRNDQDEGRDHHVRSAFHGLDGCRHDHVQSIDHSSEDKGIYLPRYGAHAYETEGTAARSKRAERSQVTSLRKTRRARRRHVEPARHRRRAKTALFSGGVVATQAGAILTSPELTVIYEGAVAPQEQAAQDGTGGTKVKQILAKDFGCAEAIVRRNRDESNGYV